MHLVLAHLATPLLKAMFAPPPLLFLPSSATLSRANKFVHGLKTSIQRGITRERSWCHSEGEPCL
jgi:hypothetical protein